MALLDPLCHSWLLSLILFGAINIVAGAILQTGYTLCFMSCNVVVTLCSLLKFGNLPLVLFKLFEFRTGYFSFFNPLFNTLLLADLTLGSRPCGKDIARPD
jgi:hypothetical protein